MKKIITSIIILLAITVSCKTKEKATDVNVEGKEITANKETDNNINNPSEELTKTIINPSFNIFKAVCENEGNKSCSFSPASLNLAFAMVYSGTAINTKKEISKVLGFNENQEYFNKDIKKYFLQLKNFEKDTTMEFSVANRIYFDKTFTLKEKYVENILSYAGKELLEEVDFLKNAPKVENDINQWVSQTTRDRIKKLIPAGALGSSTKTVLVNAIYFKSNWLYTFDKNLTEEKKFNISKDESKNIAFMKKTLKNGISFYQNDNIKAIELPYKTNNISLIIILPKNSTSENINDYIPNEEQYFEICDNLTNTPVKIELPKFKTESSFELSKLLMSQGMVEVFQKGDFSNMSNDKSLKISAVFQKVFFEVDEKGSEAAAATAILIRTTSIHNNVEVKYEEFIADHPFIYILKENLNNTPLFIGKFSE